MRVLLFICVLVLGGTVYAQANTPPDITVTSAGQPVSTAEVFEVAPGDPFNSLQIAYVVDDVDMDDVGCTATVSDEQDAVNWTAGDFFVPKQVVPWNENILSATGEFGSVGTEHDVLLTFDDGQSTPIFFAFKIAVVDPNSVGLATDTTYVPGSDGSGCAAYGSPILPWTLVAVVVGVAYLRQRRRNVEV